MMDADQTNTTASSEANLGMSGQDEDLAFAGALIVGIPEFNQDANDIFKAFNVNHSTLRFDDLFGDSHDINEPADKLLDGTWDAGSWGHDTFPIGGGGHGTFLWNNTNIGHGEDANDIIKASDVNHSTLRFDDLFGDSHDASEILGKLLARSWENDTCLATDGSASIELNTQGSDATLNVSYEHEGQLYAQTVEFGSYGALPLLIQNEEAIAHLLHEIITVGS